MIVIRHPQHVPRLLRTLPQLLLPAVRELRHLGEGVAPDLVRLPAERRIRPPHEPALRARHQREERGAVSVKRPAVAPGAGGNEQPGGDGIAELAHDNREEAGEAVHPAHKAARLVAHAHATEANGCTIVDQLHASKLVENVCVIRERAVAQGVRKFTCAYGHLGGALAAIPTALDNHVHAERLSFEELRVSSRRPC